MAITHEVEMKKNKKKWKPKAKTLEEKEAVRQKIKQEKEDFVNQLIKDAEENKRFPWDSGIISKAPKSIAKLELYKSKKAENVIPAEKAEYRGSNRLVLTLTAIKRGFKDSRWITIGEINKLKAKVKPEERKRYCKIRYIQPAGEIVTRFNPDTGKDEPVYEKDKEGNILTDKNGMPLCKRNKLTLEKTYVVYNVEQVEGLQLEPETNAAQINEDEKCTAMESILTHSEAPISYDQSRTGNSFYRPSDDSIHLPERKMFNTLQNFYGTAAHEIGHSTGNSKRLNRNMTGTFGTADYAKEELIAELTAVFLKQELGINMLLKDKQKHEAYLLSWDQKIKFLKDKPMEFYKVCSQAEQAKQYIMDHMLEKTLKIDLYKDRDAGLQNNPKDLKDEKTKIRGIQRPTTRKGMER